MSDQHSFDWTSTSSWFFRDAVELTFWWSKHRSALTLTDGDGADVPVIWVERISWKPTWCLTLVLGKAMRSILRGRFLRYHWNTDLWNSEYGLPLNRMHHLWLATPTTSTYICWIHILQVLALYYPRILISPSLGIDASNGTSLDFIAALGMYTNRAGLNKPLGFWPSWCRL